MPGTIDTGQARTDLYGLGKGDAQVFDLGNAQDQINEGQKLKFAREQVHQKRRDKNQEDIYKSMGDLDKVAIYAGHRPDFAVKQKGLTDFVEQNISKLKEGDTDTFMQWQDMYSDIRTNAELSKNFREQKEAAAMQVIKDPAAYRDESIDYLNEAGRNPDGSMSFELDPGKIRKNVDLMGDFRTNVRPVIEDVAKGKSYSYTDAQGNEHSVDHNSFDEKQATVLLQDRLKHGEVAEQAAYEYNKLPKEEQDQYSDYNDYYIKKMLPLAIVDQTKTTDKKAADNSYVYKNGSWSNDDFAWSYNKGSVAENAKPAPGFKQGDVYEEISLSNRKSESDNKPIALTQANGETIYGVPKGIIKNNGWDMWRVGIEEIDKKTGKPAVDKEGRVKISYVPVKNNRAKIQGEYGFDMDSAIKEIEKGASSGTKTETKNSKTVTLSQEDQDALDWANANPTDARAKAIKNKLKAKGVK